MKKFINQKLYVSITAVLTIGVLLVMVYAGVQYWNTKKDKALEFQKEQQAKLEIQKEQESLKNELKEKSRDEEIADLKQQLLDLKNKPSDTKTINNTVTVEAKDATVDIVKKWSPRVAHMECSWFNTSGALYAKASGSATIVNFTNLGVRAITSKHILVYNNYAPQDCQIELIDGTSYSVLINKNNVSIGENEDWAYVTLPKDAILESITKQNVKLCQSVEVGDKLLVLGYPKIGSKTGLTVTEGILSGTDGDYYITSAKIDKGNSGGAAILVKDDCYLGIPSASVVGTIESLGRILKASFVIAN